MTKRVVLASIVGPTEQFMRGSSKTTISMAKVSCCIPMAKFLSLCGKKARL